MSKNRIISSDRVRQIRKPKTKILIAVEGKNKTEKNYFNNFENGQRPYNISYARGTNTDPLNLVTMLIKEIKELGLNLQNGDMAYCVFDTDTNQEKNIIINKAIELAKKNRIIVITSSPCFEIWFLLHYIYTTASMSNDDVIKALKKHYSKYEKNINIYPYIKENLNEAILRSKRLEQYHLNNNHTIGNVEANPNTEVYKVIEYLTKNN